MRCLTDSSKFQVLNKYIMNLDKFVGEIQSRVHLTNKLLQYGGHIGYGINPKYWNMGYGTKMLKMALGQYNDLIEDENILITCDDDNIASAKIIEANGGVLENKIRNVINDREILTRRYWIKKS